MSYDGGLAMHGLFTNWAQEKRETITKDKEMKDKAGKLEVKQSHLHDLREVVSKGLSGVKKM